MPWIQGKPTTREELRHKTGPKARRKVRLITESPEDYFG